MSCDVALLPALSTLSSQGTSTVQTDHEVISYTDRMRSINRRSMRWPVRIGTILFMTCVEL